LLLVGSVTTAGCCASFFVSITADAVPLVLACFATGLGLGSVRRASTVRDSTGVETTGAGVRSVTGAARLVDPQPEIMIAPNIPIIKPRRNENRFTS
jgi:hypothetical protein